MGGDAAQSLAVTKLSERGDTWTTDRTPVAAQLMRKLVAQDRTTISLSRKRPCSARESVRVEYSCSVKGRALMVPQRCVRELVAFATPSATKPVWRKTDNGRLAGGLS